MRIEIDSTGMSFGFAFDDLYGAITLPVNCANCGGPMTLQFIEVGPDVVAEQVVYSCPWCDSAESRYRMPGRLQWVTRGHEAERPPQH
jgi:hypothetical protein